jgi:hypothetical protein
MDSYPPGAVAQKSGLRAKDHAIMLHCSAGRGMLQCSMDYCRARWKARTPARCELGSR